MSSPPSLPPPRAPTCTTHPVTPATPPYQMPPLQPARSAMWSCGITTTPAACRTGPSQTPRATSVPPWPSPSSSVSSSSWRISWCWWPSSPASATAGAGFTSALPTSRSATSSLAPHMWSTSVYLAARHFASPLLCGSSGKGWCLWPWLHPYSACCWLLWSVTPPWWSHCPRSPPWRPTTGSTAWWCSAGVWRWWLASSPCWAGTVCAAWTDAPPSSLSTPRPTSFSLSSSSLSSSWLLACSIVPSTATCTRVHSWAPSAPASAPWLCLKLWSPLLGSLCSAGGRYSCCYWWISSVSPASVHYCSAQTSASPWLSSTPAWTPSSMPWAAVRWGRLSLSCCAAAAWGLASVTQTHLHPRRPAAPPAGGTAWGTVLTRSGIWAWPPRHQLLTSLAGHPKNIVWAPPPAACQFQVVKPQCAPLPSKQDLCALIHI